MTLGSPVPPLHVSVIAANPETIQGLRDYLRHAGVSTDTRQGLQAATPVPLSAAAVVLFPDELDAPEVMRWVASLRTARPRVLIVAVTSLPQRLHPALDPDGRSSPPLVLPKPAFGWSILDAIRAHASSAEPPC